METANTHQTLLFPTDAIDLYNCIMNARIHSYFTGDEAIIEDKEGTDFSAFGGYITGKNVVLERGKKIIQTWRGEEEGWPESHFSEVVFVLKDIEGGCELDFFHTGIPAHKAAAIENGWTEYYWEPLRIYLNR